MKLTESCVIDQHNDRLLKGVEPANSGLGPPDAAAPIVRIVRGTANDMAMAPKQGQDADVVPPIELENSLEHFDHRAWKQRGVRALSLLRFARRNGNPATRGSGSDATMDGPLTVRPEADGRVQGPCK